MALRATKGVEDAVGARPFSLFLPRVFNRAEGSKTVRCSRQNGGIESLQNLSRAVSGAVFYTQLLARIVDDFHQ
jgi:hypothetical protein